jgi:hypothetical protein
MKKVVVAVVGVLLLGIVTFLFVRREMPSIDYESMST